MRGIWYDFEAARAVISGVDVNLLQNREALRQANDSLAILQEKERKIAGNLFDIGHMPSLEQYSDYEKSLEICHIELESLDKDRRQIQNNITELMKTIESDEGFQKVRQLQRMKTVSQKLSDLRAVLRDFYRALSNFLRPTPFLFTSVYADVDLISSMQNIVAIETEISDIFLSLGLEDCMNRDRSDKTVVCSLLDHSRLVTGWTAHIDQKQAESSLPEIKTELYILDVAAEQIRASLDLFSQSEGIEALAEALREQETLLVKMRAEFEQNSGSISLLSSRYSELVFQITSFKRVISEVLNLHFPTSSKDIDAVSQRYAQQFEEVQVAVADKKTVIIALSSEIDSQKQQMMNLRNELIAEYQKLAKILLVLGSGVMAAGVAMQLLALGSAIVATSLVVLGGLVAYKGMRLFQESKRPNIETKQLSSCMTLN